MNVIGWFKCKMGKHDFRRVIGHGGTTITICDRCYEVAVIDISPKKIVKYVDGKAYVYDTDYAKCEQRIDAAPELDIQFDDATPPGAYQRDGFRVESGNSADHIRTDRDMMHRIIHGDV